MGKKWFSVEQIVAVLKPVVRYVQASHGYSEPRACALTRQHRSTQRMHEIVRTRVR